MPRCNLTVGSSNQIHNHKLTKIPITIGSIRNLVQSIVDIGLRKIRTEKQKEVK